MTEEFDTGNATGRLMLTMLSGFASHERDVIRERSVAGIQRVAEGGAWLGGMKPRVLLRLLLWAPLYAGWKLSVTGRAALGAGRKEWARTTRAE